MIGKNETQQILDSIRRLVQGLRASSRKAEADLGISGAQLFVLQKLSQATRLSINELAERTATHQSSVSVVVSRLVEQKLVARSQSSTDRRRQELLLTAKGRALLKRVPATAQERLIESLEKMAPSRRAQLSRLLDAWVRASGLAGQTPALFFEEGSSHERKR